MATEKEEREQRCLQISFGWQKQTAELLTVAIDMADFLNEMRGSPRTQGMEKLCESRARMEQTIQITLTNLEATERSIIRMAGDRAYEVAQGFLKSNATAMQAKKLLELSYADVPK